MGQKVNPVGLRLGVNRTLCGQCSRARARAAGKAVCEHHARAVPTVDLRLHQRQAARCHALEAVLQELVRADGVKLRGDVRLLALNDFPHIL